MDKSDLLTARELADLLRPYGDLPVKLRTFDGNVPTVSGEDPCCVTLIERGAIDITIKNGQNTVFGDLDLVRIDIRAIDNA